MDKWFGGEFHRTMSSDLLKLNVNLFLQNRLIRWKAVLFVWESFAVITEKVSVKRWSWNPHKGVPDASPRIRRFIFFHYASSKLSLIKQKGWNDKQDFHEESWATENYCNQLFMFRWSEPITWQSYWENNRTGNRVHHNEQTYAKR